MKRKFGSKIGIDCPSQMMKATPRNAAIVPRVAITALTPPTRDDQSVHQARITA